MEKKRKLPKVVMAVSVAVMGMGLFSSLQNEARATGSCVVCDNINEDECQRVLVGNEAHYYSGPKSDCPD